MTKTSAVLLVLASACVGGCNEILGMDEGKPIEGEAGGGAGGTASSSTGMLDEHWGCLGNVTLPTEQAEITYSFDLKDGMNPPTGLSAKLCEASDPSCTAPVTDPVNIPMGGQLTLSVTPTFYGFLELGGASYKPTLLVLGPPTNLPRPLYPVGLFNEGGFDFIVGILGFSEDPTRGTAFVLATDCTMTPTAGIRIAAPNADTMTTQFYFVGGADATNVSTMAGETEANGLGGFLNLPAGENVIRTLRASDGQVVGETTVHIRPETITAVRLGPTPP